MVHRLAVVHAVHVAHAVLFAGVELDAVAVRAALRLDRDHAVRRRRSVERRAGGALDDLDRLDVESAELTQVADVHDDAVDDDERLGAAAGDVDRRRAAHHDFGRRARLAACRGDAHAGDLALECRHRVERRNRQLFRRYAADGEGHLRALGRFDGSRDDHFVQPVDVLLEREVLGLRTRREADRNDAWLETDGANPKVDRLAERSGQQES